MNASEPLKITSTCTYRNLPSSGLDSSPKLRGAWRAVQATFCNTYITNYPLDPTLIMESAKFNFLIQKQTPPLEYFERPKVV